MGESWSKVRLVARRELVERLRTKAFLISTLIVVLIALAFTVVPRFVNIQSTDAVGTVGAPPAGFAESLEQAAKDSGNAAVVTPFASLAAAEAALRDGKVDVVYDPAGHQLVWQAEPAERVQADVRRAVATVQVLERAEQLGLSADDLTQLTAGAQVSDRSLDPVDPDHNAKIAVALFGTILLFIAIQMAGGFIVSGVVEEKTSRIVEVLLSQVRPHQLLAGKVIGIGTLATGQLALVGLVALAGGISSGSVSSSSIALTAVSAVVVWFVLGFAFYAVAFAAAGSLVNRQEDAQSVTFPVMLPLFIGYMISFVVLGSPDLALGRWLSMFPPTAPVLMPLRMQLGVATPAEVGVAIVLMIAACYGLIRLGGRVYAGAIMRTSGKVKVRDALRSGREVASI